MDKSKLIIGKTWTEFWIYCAYSIVFWGGMTYSLLTDYSPEIALFLFATFIMFVYFLFKAYPGSYVLLDQNGITCVKKESFSREIILHYDWKSCEKVVFGVNIISLISKDKEVYVKCKDYGGLIIQFNGKKKICLAPNLGVYIGKICKENNVPFEDIPYAPYRPFRKTNY